MSRIKSTPASSIILVDIGNTSTQAAVECAGRFILTKRIPTPGQTADDARKLLDYYVRQHDINGAMLCSVVPELDKIWMNALKKIVGNGRVLRLNHRLNLGIKIKYPNPATIGADRLANAAAAFEKYGVPVVAADFGTALTVDFVGKDGAYEGGIIAPGPMMFAGCLAKKTALLPQLSLPAIRRTMLAKKNLPMIGKNTKQAMLTGLRFGYPGLVKEIFAHIMRDPRYKSARLCATGGYAKMALAGTGLKIDIDPFLTLRGMSLIYRLNPMSSFQDRPGRCMAR